MVDDLEKIIPKVHCPSVQKVLSDKVKAYKNEYPEPQMLANPTTSLEAKNAVKEWALDYLSSLKKMCAVQCDLTLAITRYMRSYKRDPVYEDDGHYSENGCDSAPESPKNEVEEVPRNSPVVVDLTGENEVEYQQATIDTQALLEDEETGEKSSILGAPVETNDNGSKGETVKDDAGEQSRDETDKGKQPTDEGDAREQAKDEASKDDAGKQSKDETLDEKKDAGEQSKDDAGKDGAGEQSKDDAGKDGAGEQSKDDTGKDVKDGAEMCQDVSATESDGDNRDDEMCKKLMNKETYAQMWIGKKKKKVQRDDEGQKKLKESPSSPDTTEEVTEN